MALKQNDGTKYGLRMKLILRIILLLLPDSVDILICVSSTPCGSSQTTQLTSQCERASFFLSSKCRRISVSGISVNWYVIFAYLFVNINYTILQFVTWNCSFSLSLVAYATNDLIWIFISLISWKTICI